MRIQKEFATPERKAYSQREKEAILEDALDPSRLQLVCGRHQYVAKEMPPESQGCKECWQAWWMHKIATTPPHLREQRLQEAERMVRNAVQMYEAGEYDFSPYDHPEIKIEKDVN